MSGVVTLPLNPLEPSVRHALSTLDGIQRFVESKMFGTTMLSRLLGVEETELELQSEWLVAQGYLEKSASGLLSLTRKGRRFEQENKSEDEGFHIVFSVEDE